MKGVFAVLAVLLVCAFVGSMLLSRVAVRDPGRQLAVAYGAPRDGKIEVHLGVPPTVPIVDPPQKDEEKQMTWQEWVDAHYKLRKNDGTAVALRRMGTSALMLGEVAAGAPEFVVWAEIEPGQDYEFDFIPVMAKKTVYRHAFTAPNAQTKVCRETFALVPDDK